MTATDFMAKRGSFLRISSQIGTLISSTDETRRALRRRAAMILLVISSGRTKALRMGESFQTLGIDSVWCTSALMIQHTNVTAALTYGGVDG